MSITTIGAGFPDSYQQARAAFLEACRRARLDIQTHINPARSAIPVELATDATYIGPPRARKVLVVTSGVHGTEMLSGSGCQTRLLKDPMLQTLPPDIGVLLVHAVNPWGAVHGRRNTEDNVDLCRNFIPFDRPPPVNAAYERVRAALLPPPTDQITPDHAARRIADMQKEFGARDFMNGLMAGQYVDPHGFSFGGTQESWSRRVLTELLQQNTSNAEHIGIIDLHTGLGPYAYGMAVCLHRGAGLTRAQRWFGSWIFAPRCLPPDSPEGLFDVTGHCSDGYEAALGEPRVTAVVMEYGSYPVQRVFPTLLQDHWLHALGDPPGEPLERVRAEMREVHHPSDPEWRESAWHRTQQIVRQGLAGLEETRS